MAHEFDTILNRLIDLRADDWAAFMAARAHFLRGAGSGAVK